MTPRPGARPAAAGRGEREWSRRTVGRRRRGLAYIGRHAARRARTRPARSSSPAPRPRRRRLLRRAESAERDSLGIRSVTLSAGERLAQLSVSPAGNAILFTTTTAAAADARSNIVPSYVTASGYTEDIPNRTKVGDAQPRTRLGFQSLPRGDVKWLRSIDSDSLIANSQVIAWNDAGTVALVSGYSSNFKTRQLSTVDAASGVLKAIAVMKDSAWVGGPCSFGCAGFYDNDRRVYFVTEATGFAQLSSTAADGSDPRALTSGTFEVYDVALSSDRKSFYFHSSEVSAFDRDLYRMPIAGGERQSSRWARAATRPNSRPTRSSWLMSTPRPPGPPISSSPAPVRRRPCARCRRPASSPYRRPPTGSPSSGSTPPS